MKIRIGRAGVEGSRGLALSWVPRRVEALSWVDGADPTVEGSRYLVTIERGGARLVREVGEAALDATAGELAALGAGEIVVDVTELGSGGPSRPARLILNP